MTASPCQNICRLDPSGQICLGCLRTLDEITRWAGMTDDQRATIVQRLASPAPAAGRV